MTSPPPATAEWDTIRYTKLDETLQMWGRRLQVLEEKMDALPERICRAMNDRRAPQPDPLPVIHVQQTLQRAMRAFTDAISESILPSTTTPTISHPLISLPFPPLQPVPVASPATTPVPPGLQRSSSANKASIANIMSATTQPQTLPDEDMPTATAGPSFLQPPPRIPTPTSSPPPHHIVSLPCMVSSADVAPFPTSDPPPPPMDERQATHTPPPYDVRPRIESSIQLTFNTLAANNHPHDGAHNEQGRGLSSAASHSFLVRETPPPPPPASPPSSLPHRAPRPNPGRRPRPATTDSSLPPPPQPTFTWSDGTVRHAPEAWEFPSTNCKTMWHHWFRGDDAHGVGPFRHLTSYDIERYARDKTSRKQLSRARTVMNKLVELALEHAIVARADDLDAMPRDALDAVFDQAFDVLMNHNPNGNLAGDGKLRAERANAYTYSSVHTFMVPTSRKRKHEDKQTNSSVVVPRIGDATSVDSMDSPGASDPGNRGPSATHRDEIKKE
ncbi:Aste57867_12140 [Aphanomyces stellatus]|uniref:Aste57867_12140 protein n=1 Tax=Aphanomyces stellatus TaxID=120398 RepID=A0A485KUT6_9STRA|nr:hypothetical protein As57867_012095 [Aphanomyces stellatus]VFT88994.1 Aste57867_12140 [Aphanomyces stellatus]